MMCIAVFLRPSFLSFSFFVFFFCFCVCVCVLGWMGAHISAGLAFMRPRGEGYLTCIIC